MNLWRNYEDLANAIVLQAVKDYRDALKRQDYRLDNKEALSIKREVERFFRSSWFTQLSDANPALILQSLKAEVV